MKVGRLLRLFLVGGTAIAMVAVVGLRSRGSERRATAPLTHATTAARAASPSVGARSIAETPAERERTLQARRLLTAALIMGAASSQGVPPAQVVAPESEAAEKPVEDAHDNRRRIVDAFVASGNATGSWTQSAPDVFSGISKSVPADLARHVNVRQVECYEKGCIADVTYSDMAAFEKAAALFIQDGAFERWPGPRGRTAPETMASGRVEVTWMLMNPSASVSADENEGRL
jgi:hypothetical protein